MVTFIGTMEDSVISRPSVSRGSAIKQEMAEEGHAQPNNSRFGHKIASPTEWSLTTRHQALADSGATALMLNGASMITGKAVSPNRTIGTAGKDVIEAKIQAESILNMVGGTETAKLNRVLRVPNAEHSLTSVLSLCNDGHTVEL